jgi:hypothetical protein
MPVPPKIDGGGGVFLTVPESSQAARLLTIVSAMPIATALQCIGITPADWHIPDRSPAASKAGASARFSRAGFRAPERHLLAYSNRLSRRSITARADARIHFQRPRYEVLLVAKFEPSGMFFPCAIL